MRLKNKKTGEIVETDKGLSISVPNDNPFYGCKTYDEIKSYTSIDKLNEEWEDYEEPKDFWFIDPETLITCESTEPLLCDKKVDIETMKQIGNYFETREEAEQAVERLRAWKRLKSCRFKFKGWRTADLGADKYYFVITAESDGAGKGDLDLLFGGKE